MIKMFSSYEEVEEFLKGVEERLKHDEEPIIKEKTNFDMHRGILDEMHKVYIDKNIRYGNSFSKQFEEFGLMSSVIRLTDKLERFKTLSSDPEIDCLDESIQDTLIDMANYAILTVMELRK